VQPTAFPDSGSSATDLRAAGLRLSNKVKTRKCRKPSNGLKRVQKQGNTDILADCLYSDLDLCRGGSGAALRINKFCTSIW